MAQGSGFSSRGALALPELRRLASPRIGSGAGGASAAADQLGGLARRLNVVGGGLFEQDLRDQLDEEARAGEQAGFGAARSGETLAARDSGFFGRRQDQAFNRAAEVAYTQGLQVQIEEQRQQLELEHEADPDGFMQAWDRYQADVLKTAPAGVRERVALDLEQHGNRADFRLAAQKEERVKAQASANVLMRADQLGTLAAQAAAGAGDYAAAAEPLGELQRSVDEALGAGLITPTQAASMLIGARDGAIEGGYFGSFMSAPSGQALQEFLEDPTPELHPARKQQLAARMRGELSRRESEVRAGRVALDKDARAALSALEKGIRVQNLPELLERTAGTEYEQRLRIAADASELVRAQAQLTPAELAEQIGVLDQGIAALQEGGTSAEDAGVATAQLEALLYVRKSAASSFQATEKAIADHEQLDRARELGLVELEPLDFGNLDEISGQVAMGRRADAAAVVEQHFGLPVGAPLTGAELDQFKQVMQAGPAETAAQIGVLSAMRQFWGEDRTRAVLDLVAEDAPRMAAAGGLLIDQPLVGQEAIRGRAILAENPKLAPGRDNKAFRDAVDDVYRDAFAGAPAGLAVAEDVARWVYASRQLEKGELSGELDVKALKQALKDVVGGDVAEWENDAARLPGFDQTSRVFPPRPGMSGADFEGLMDALTDAELAIPIGGTAEAIPVDVNHNPVSAAVIRRTARLENYARGQYLVTIAGFRVVRSDNGLPYVLDLERALRQLEARGEDVGARGRALRQQELLNRSLLRTRGR